MVKNKFNNRPKVSVILPVYNAERFLKQALNSLLQQTFRDFEIIAIDDNSSDNSLEILNKYKQKHSNFFVLTNKENLGNSYTLNKAISYSRGKYIVRMDADDIIYKTKLEKQVRFLENNPSIDVVGCGYNRINIYGEVIFKHRSPERHEEIIKLLNIRKFFISGPNFEITDGTIMGKREWFKKWKYDPNIYYSQDFDMICRSFRYSKFANLKEILYNYRTGSGVTANIKAQRIATKIKKRAINNLPDNTFSFYYRLLLNLSLFLRPLFYILILTYQKIKNRG